MRSCIHKSEIENIEGDRVLGRNPSNMGKEDRKRLVLEFMEEYPLALPPRAIYRNMKLLWSVTFSWRSTQTYLDEFEDEGLVMRVEKGPLDDGEVVEASEDSRAYYLITDAGRDELDDS